MSRVTHDLKTWPSTFEALYRGLKRFEFRKNDRNFQIYDMLMLREWDPNTAQYTGRVLGCWVSYLLRGPEFGVPEGYVVMSLTEPLVC